MSTTTQRLSSLLVATLFIVLLALMATFGVRSAAAQGPPVGGCPPGYTLETVEFVVAGAGLEEPDPSMDPNGDGNTCLKLVAGKARGVPFHSPDSGTGPPAEGDGVRATWHDNVRPL
jgi:hypothetical protein